MNAIACRHIHDYIKTQILSAFATLAMPLWRASPLRSDQLGKLANYMETTLPYLNISLNIYLAVCVCVCAGNIIANRCAPIR